MKILIYKKKLIKLIQLNFIKKKHILLMNGFLATIIFNYNPIKLIYISDNQLIIHKTYIRSFFSNLFQLIKGISHGYKFNLKLKGKGLRIQLKLKNNFIFLYLKLGYSHKIFFKLPLNCWIKIIDRRRSIILYSINYQLLRQLIKKLRSYYPLTLYKLRGFLESTEQIKLKKGNLN